VCLLLQSTAKSHLGCFCHCLIPKIRPRHSSPPTTTGFARSGFFRRFLPTHNSKTPFKTHNYFRPRLRSTDSIDSVQAKKLMRQWQSNYQA
jgi:hypothetical protein